MSAQAQKGSGDPPKPQNTSSSTPLSPQAQIQAPPQPGSLRSGRKRDTTEPPKKVPQQKRLRDTIIDDDVACILLKELRINKAFYNSGRVLAWAVQPDDPIFIPIHEYVAQGQAHGFGLQVKSILRVICKGDPMGHQVPLDFNEDPKAKGKLRMMLWHGTKKNLVAAILTQGFRLPQIDPYSPPPMFGRGIYFADRVSKSYGYTHYRSWINNAVAYLLLCDVLLGEIYESAVAIPFTASPPAKVGPAPNFRLVPCDSVKGVGQRVPDVQGHKEIDGCIWPLGPTVDSSSSGTSFAGQLKYNEYVVYKPEQVQPKYLVKVRITPKPVFEKLC